MHTPLAFHNLLHGKWRTVVSTSGVSLAVVLIFMQLGFLGAVAATATQIYDHLAFDVLLRSPDYFHFCDPRQFPRSYLYQVASMREVASVKPLQVTLATWRIPETAETLRRKTAGELRGIVAMGIDLDSNVFDLPEVERQLDKLTSPHHLLMDSKTKGNDYGAADGRRFGEADLGREVEVWDQTYRIVGRFSLGAGLAANGSVLMSSEGFSRFYPGEATRAVSFGLVRLHAATDPIEFCRNVQERLAPASARQDRTNGESAAALPVVALTRDEVRNYERYRWLVQTPIGAIFMAGVAVALVVGGVVVYMVLSNDVANHMHEYATLKAMGYTNAYLSRVVMQQAVLMAVLGYVVALACAEVLYRAVGYLANLPMEMSWPLRLFVLALSVLMCSVSGLATLRKLRSADPADLF